MYRKLIRNDFLDGVANHFAGVLLKHATKSRYEYIYTEAYNMSFHRLAVKYDGKRNKVAIIYLSLITLCILRF